MMKITKRLKFFGILSVFALLPSLRAQVTLVVAITILLGLVSAKAQTVVTSPITLNLQPEAIGDETVGGEQFYKYGIYASLGGSTTPQLYELDTGAPGFYAAYSTNPVYDSSAWGTNYQFISTNGGMSYVSSNDYVGDVVGTSVSLYSADGNNGYLTGSVISTGPVGSTNIAVGQVTSISSNGVVNWPSTNAPPIDGHFYGDFGAALTTASNGVMNLLGQLNYGNGVIPGFVLSLGASGSTNPTLQIGISSNQLSQYPYQFQINGLNTTNPFPLAYGSSNVIPTYAEGAITASYSFSNNSVNWTNTGAVVLDTGASGFLRNDTNSTNLDPIIDGKIITDGVSFNLSLTNSNGVISLDYSAVTGTNADNITFNVQSGGFYALNIGQDLFHEYNVAYDLQDGIIAFQPITVPEPSTYALFGLGFLVIALIRRRSLPLVFALTRPISQGAGSLKPATGGSRLDCRRQPRSG
jgi:hypothetical protein